MSEIRETVYGGRIEAHDLSIEWRDGKDTIRAIDRVGFSIVPGEFVCLLGPSGCGKSTLLGALAGHIRISTGSIVMDGGEIVAPSPERGLVFQHHTLFPWKSVVDNVAFGLKMKGVSKSARLTRARELLNLVGLSEFEKQYPIQLSGGMQQRVEIARVLINQPRVLLMDEPFSALDAQTRWSMQQLLLQVWHGIRTTVVFVTHDIDEALFLADRVLVMSRGPGRIREEIAVHAARPRGDSWLTSSEFIRLKRHCLDLIHDERVNGEAGRHRKPEPIPRLAGALA